MASTEPKCTAVVPWNEDPVITTFLPPVVRPELGVRPFTTGARKVYRSDAEGSDGPWGVVTTTRRFRPPPTG